MAIILLTESPLVYNVDGEEQEPLSHDCGNGHTLRYFQPNGEKELMLGPVGFDTCENCTAFLNS